MTQVNDDLELLELMMADRLRSPDLYQPHERWLNFEKNLLPELRVLGLRDFRRRKNSVLSRFGATDLLPKSQYTDHTLVKIIQSLLQLKKIEKLCSIISKTASGVDLEKSRLLHYELAKFYGEKNGAKSICELKASKVGNPEDVFSIDGHLYTLLLLSYYCQYAYCCKYMDFNSINTIMELASGGGKQIEVIKKLHPDICFYIFDVPPQLYVCEQYLSALFPDSVVSYRQTRTMTNIPKQHEGKIFVFGTWKLSQLTNLNYDLFWSGSSLGGLEPEMVLNYLKYVNRQTNKYAFLCELMKGSEHRVRKKTTLEHYKRGLEDFLLQDLSRAVLPVYTSREPFSFSFWNRKQKKIIDPLLSKNKY